MSSLRLALKQSLQETGHLFKDKKKKSGNRSNSNKSSSGGGGSGKGRRARQPGDPPRKRGRPRKHPLPDEQQGSSSGGLQHSMSADSHADSRGDGDEGENHRHHHHHHHGRDPRRGNHSGSEEEESESENEFSYDSEEEEDDSEEEGEENEDDDEDDQNDDSHANEDESGHPDEEEDAPTAVSTGPASPREHESASSPKKSSRHEEEADSDDERRRQKKLFKKHLQQAANKIQAQWKKKAGLSTSSRGDGDESEGEEGTAGDSDGEPSKPSASSPTRNRDGFSNSNNSTPTANGAEKKKKKGHHSGSGKAQTVPPPEQDVLEWNRSLSEKKSRKHVSTGMRVKVRFAAKVKREGKVVKKKIWYGGRVSAVSKEGSKIRIKYDDGTSEISKFPDKDVVVDDAFNGRHQVPADRFIPPQREEDVHEEEEEQELQVDVDEDSKPSAANATEAPEAAQKTSDSVMIPTSNQDDSTEAKKESPMDVEEKTSEPVSANEETQPSKGDTAQSESVSPEENSKPATDLIPATKPDEKEPGAMSTPAPKSTGTIIASAIAAAEQGHLPRNLGSPEEGEVSPGLSFASRAKAESATEALKPTEKGDTGLLETSEAGEISADADADAANTKGVEPQPEASTTTDKISEPPSSSDAKTQDVDKAVELSKPGAEGVLQAESPTTPKRNLTIRISNAKLEKDVEMKTPKTTDSDSEEELFADTPITERKVKSIQLKRKAKRKREAADMASEDQPSKKRIHLKKGEADDDKSDLSMSQVEDAISDKSVDVQGAVEALGALADPEHMDGGEKKSNTTISISLRKPEIEDDEHLLLPKLKKKKERASSPVAKDRKSPVPRSQSPLPTADSRDADSTATGSGMIVDTVPTSPSRAKGVVSMREGATEDAEDFNPETPASEDISAGAVDKQSLPRSKGSAESLPSMRSGRRAAQQAKEKMNPKQDDKGPESVKKKKKRKRTGDEEGEQSDESVDDRQWVQCDSCAKWRILPSHIKISSLPKHWYCHLNTYDPKRNNCNAPEQTAKQAAKEWRKARKRAKQQRLAEKQAAEAVVAPEEAVSENKKELLASSSPKPTKVVKKEKSESKRASPIGMEEAQAVFSEPSVTKPEKKGKKVKQQQQPPLEVVEAPAPEPTPVPETEAPKKPGRKRGRPARNQTPQKEKGAADNVEWVQCEKCEKWRKLPPHISADELPDTWYCLMNTWNPDSASCDAPEDKADATHHEVGGYAGMFGAGAGKYSYRAMIFGNGKKHNRPMSERSRAAESLFMRPVDEVENPYPTVMYSKSSCFLPRSSNFTKANATEEEKPPSIFDVLSNSELWAELGSVGQPVQVPSSNVGQFPKFLNFENLPEDLKQAMRDIVLRSLGDGTLTAEEVMLEVQGHPWETFSPDLALIRGCFNVDIIVNSLLALVRDGVVEMTSIRNFAVPMDQWVPKYRKVRSLHAMKIEASIKASRCMKISKPWKQREGKSDWVTGAPAFT